jgi:hypothetical protein
MKRIFTVLASLLILHSSCGTVQSLAKSTFPYTTTLVVSASAQPGTEYSAVSLASSFVSSGDKVKQVKATSAKLQATTPSDYNIGNLASVNIYVSDADGTNEVLVASRGDIGPNVGNNLVLDIDNSHTLDDYIRKPKIRIHMVYKVRKAETNTDVSLKLILGLNAKAS